MRLISVDFLSRLLSIGRNTPQTATVFFLAGIIGFLQLPASLLMRLSQPLGIAINEIGFIAGVPLLLVVLCRFDRRTLFPLHLPSRQASAASLLLLIGGVLALEYLLAASELLFPLPADYKAELKTLMDAPSTLALIKKIFLLSIIPGICEELFFRGFAQTSLTIERGPLKGMMIASLLFALMHGNPWYAHLYFLLSLLFSISYAASGTLLMPIAAHILNNAWTVWSSSAGLEFPRYSFTHPLDVTLMTTAALLILVAAFRLRWIKR